MNNKRRMRKLALTGTLLAPLLTGQPLPGDPNYAAFWSQWTVTPSSLTSISPVQTFQVHLPAPLAGWTGAPNTSYFTQVTSGF